MEIKQNIYWLAICVFFINVSFGKLVAQTTIFDQTLLTQSSFNVFTPVNVVGAQGWNFSSSYGAVCSGYLMGQNYENQDWLVSGPINLYQATDVKLTFSHTRGSASVMNVGLAEGWYKVYATANYTGDPLTTQWSELSGFNQNIPTAWQFVSSGDLIIPDGAKSQNSRIAFRYQSGNSESATWEVKNVKITGITPNAANMFKITNWNIEWLGCTTMGPEDETLQINNAASAMLSMDSDIYCLQEISNTVSSPSIATLVSLMGNEQWAGSIVPSTTGDCSQRQAILYKKSKVQFVSAAEMNSGSSAQGNSYSYNWSSGRYPALYNVNLVAASSLIPVSLVNIHAKAEDGNAMSYTRRKGASESLKAILDGPNYNIKNVIVIGDFNDYLVGTTSEACGCIDSPFKNFMDDTVHYNGITKDLIHAYSGWQQRPIIEHFIVSDELSDNFVVGGVTQEVSVTQTIGIFLDTTSNHLPVSALFDFSTLSVVGSVKHSWSVYPTIVSDKLHFSSAQYLASEDTEIYDLTGRRILTGKIVENSIDVSTLPSGVYIVKLNAESRKFIKK